MNIGAVRKHLRGGLLLFAVSVGSALFLMQAEASPATGEELKPGNVLRIAVSTGGKYEVSPLEVRISGNGDIVLPFIGKVECRGLTLDGLRGRLIARYGEFYRNPDVMVQDVMQDQSQSFDFAQNTDLPKDGVSGTTNETERFWAAVASSATRIVTKPRLKDADAEKGEGMLEAFGTQYMPNAYNNYEKVRAKALEREQMLKEKFPEGAKSDTTGGNLYWKIAKATAKAISEYYRRHDELCHFYLMHKAGIMADAELAELDESKISVMLPLSGEMPAKWNNPAAPKQDELDFARKYKPETFAAYERLKAVYDEGVKQHDSLLADALVLDAIRAGGVLAPLASRLAGVSGKLQGIAKTLSEENLLHEVEEITADQLADSDAKFDTAIRAFEKTLPVRDYAKAWLAKNWTEKEWGSVAYLEGAPLLGLKRTMVPIPGRNYAMCKYEVTQSLWETVMGWNPSKFRGANLPVENVSWNDCQDFLRKLNALPEVKASGRIYRLPTEDEWVFACRAGAMGPFCKLANGMEITEKTLGIVAWYERNSNVNKEGKQTHHVGQKVPNAFGLYDMLGNVREWISKVNYGDRYNYGGYWNSPLCTAFDQDCDGGYRDGEKRDYSGSRGWGEFGLRLAYGAGSRDDIFD